MLTSRFKLALVALTASAGLTGCVGMDPYGYSGVSVGYGAGYGYGDPYYGYGYGDPYGYGYGDPYYGAGYGYGYGAPYYGWYDNYYYPGTGYYVYSRSGTRQRWSDSQRRYWERRRGNRQTTSGANWSGYRNPTTTTTTTTTRPIYRAPRQGVDRVRATRETVWQQRAQPTRATSSSRQESRRAAREERRSERRSKRD